MTEAAQQPGRQPAKGPEGSGADLAMALPRREIDAPVAACYVALAVLGALLGMWGAFLVPFRLPGGIEGLAVAVAVVGNLGAGLLGGYGTGSRLGAGVPGIAWLIVAFVAGLSRPEGDLVVPGSVQTDPGVGKVGMAFLLLGAVAAAFAVGLSPGGRRQPRTK